MARLRLHRSSSKYLLKTLRLLQKEHSWSWWRGHLEGPGLTGCWPVLITSRQGFQCLFSTSFIPST